MKPYDTEELSLTSTLDGSAEPSLLHLPHEDTDVPLVVGLHTWSAERDNQISRMLPLCRERNWALLLPEFRGANLDTNPRAREACGSRLAQQDVLDAVHHVTTHYPIDASNVFLLGGSGGGHMALMMAAKAPTLWKAVSCWCPITDLAAWHSQNRHYAPHIEACCGGEPRSSREVDREYELRSPIHYTPQIARANISIHHGRFDQSVPCTHTLDLVWELEKHTPDHCFHEIFDGGHELRYPRAFEWFEAQLEGKQQADELTD